MQQLPRFNHSISNITAIYSPIITTRFSRPILNTKIHAGFPSPAEQYIEGRLDLNKHIVKHPSSTFFVTVEGDSMEGENIHDGDLLVVDRAAEATDKTLVVVRIGQEFCVRKLRIKGDRVWFAAANPKYPPLEMTEDSDFEIWGCVTFSFRKH